MEVSRLGVQLELHLLAYTTATATSDPRQVCNLDDSSWQHWILNPLSETRDQTCNLMVPIWIHFCYATTETPLFIYLFIYLFIETLESPDSSELFKPADLAHSSLSKAGIPFLF